MSVLTAMNHRVSRRVYSDQVIPTDILEQIDSSVNELNQKATIRIEHIADASDTFESIDIDYGFFKNVNHILAFYGKTSDQFRREQAGYFGEQLLLEMVDLGLGTCWIGASYNKESNIFNLAPDEELMCIISFGYSPTEMTTPEAEKRKMRRSMDHALEEFYQSEVTPPSWFLDGVQSVRRGPSSMNSQPVRFLYNDDKAVIYVNEYTGSNCTDLGIAKAHFEYVAGGRFAFGNHATFEKK